MAAFEPALPSNVQRALQLLKQRLRDRFGAGFLELRLFGSFARGEQHEESDIDVLILFADDHWDRDAFFHEVAAVDVAERVWISPLPLSAHQYAQMVADESGLAESIEDEGLRV